MKIELIRSTALSVQMVHPRYEDSAEIEESNVLLQSSAATVQMVHPRYEDSAGIEETNVLAENFGLKLYGYDGTRLSVEDRVRIIRRK